MPSNQIIQSEELSSLDLNVRQDLAESLNYIFQQTSEPLNLDLDECRLCLEYILKNKVSAATFARYYDLVFSIQHQDLKQAKNLIKQILKLNLPKNAASHIEKDNLKLPNLSIVSFSKEFLNDDLERFPRLVFSGFSHDQEKEEFITNPSQELYNAYRQKIIHAIEIIESVDSSIAEEIKTIVNQIIVAVNHESHNNIRSFGAVSSLIIWGTIIINAKHYQTLYDVVECLVHELTHCILLGLSCKEPLVLNDKDERYPSPLRSDSRPMDGVYHATLVCARLTHFMEKWQRLLNEKKLTQDTLPDCDKRLDLWLKQRIDDNHQAFLRGVTTLNHHAKLSPCAKRILKDLHL